MDFFIDEEETPKSPSLHSSTKTIEKAPPTASSSSVLNVASSMDAIKTLITPELVKKVNGVYAFSIADANPQDWYLDLKNGNGDLASGKFNGTPNCSLTMNSDVFISMVSGKVKPTAAFMSGKLKIKGDMGLAMKLEKLMGSVKISQTKAPAAPVTSNATPTSSGSTTDVEGSMNQIKKLITPELVKSMNGVYAFSISDANPQDWYLDLKNGNGTVASGKFNGTANCTLTMKSDVFVSMVGGKIKPTAAFMSGKLKIKGDMGLAMKLEKLMGSLKSKL
jgi:putative sterol carrier protein